MKESLKTVFRFNLTIYALLYFLVSSNLLKCQYLMRTYGLKTKCDNNLQCNVSTGEKIVGGGKPLEIR